MAVLAGMQAGEKSHALSKTPQRAVTPDIETDALTVLSSSEAPLLFIRAPAGFGKTICLEQLASRVEKQGRRTVWCSLQELAEKLKTASEATYFIDCGVHNLSGPVEGLIDLVRTTAGAQVRIAVRQLPDINWTSYDFDNTVKIVGPEHLTFSVEQISRLFRGLRSSQTGEFRAKELLALTGGWPLAIGAALQRARARGDKWFGDVASIAQLDTYRGVIESKVLSELPGDFLVTLQHLASMQLISPAIAQHVLGRSVDAELALAYQNYGLISPAPAHPEFYVMNPLVRKVLARSVGGNTERIGQAARWYLKHEMADEAIEHFLDADEAKQACHVLQEWGSQLLRTSGDIIRMSRWIDRIESSDVELPATLRLWRTWALTHSQRIEEAAAELELAERWLRDHPNPADQAYADRLRVGLASRRGDLDEVERLGELWLDTWRDLEPHSAVGVCILISMAKAYFNDELAQRRMLMRAREYAIRCGNHPSNLWILAIEALAELDAGRAKLASEFADRAMESCARLCGTETPIYNLLTILSARVHLELGDTAKAGDLLDESYLATRNYSLPETNLTAQLVRIAVLEDRFGCDAAIAAIHESGLIGNRYREFGDVLAAELLVRHGRYDEARRRLSLLLDGLAPDDQGNLGHEYKIVDCMILIAEEKYAEANAILPSLLEHADAHGQKRRAVTLLLLRAACEWRLGRETSARRFFSRAVAIAATGPLYMTVMNMSWVIKELVARASNRDAANSQANAFVTTLKKRMGVEDEFHELDEREPAIGQLTPREREIVGLLDSTMKVPELADYLGLGVSTLKWHLRNIYSKLCVSNRSGAVAVARRCAII